MENASTIVKSEPPRIRNIFGHIRTHSDYSDYSDYSEWSEYSVWPESCVHAAEWLGSVAKGYALLDLFVSSLRRGHANFLLLVPILVYVLPKQVQQFEEIWLL